MDSPRPDYTESPLWAQILIMFSAISLSRRKNQFPMFRLKAETERVITAISRTYFTDGSVDLQTRITSVSFAARDATTSTRVTDNTSLQAEAVAIIGALAHAP